MRRGLVPISELGAGLLVAGLGTALLAGSLVVRSSPSLAQTSNAAANTPVPTAKAPASRTPAATASKSAPASTSKAGVPIPAKRPDLAPAEIAAKLKPPPLPRHMQAEAAFNALLDKAIAPARDIAISVEDAETLRAGVKAFLGRDPGGGEAAIAKLKGPVARKLLTWAKHRAGYGTAKEIVAFHDANPDWPDRDTLMDRAEEQLFTSGGQVGEIKAFFAKRQPRSAVGWAALASAYLAEGNETKARELAAKAWRDYDIPQLLETGFLERFGKLLTEADHRWRLDVLLLDEARWRREKNIRAVEIRRVIALLSEPEQKKAIARLSTFLGQSAAAKLMAEVEKEATADWGLAFQRVQLLRRQNKHEEAWKILLSAPTDAKTIVSPDGWWVERELAAREALEKGMAKLAYDLVLRPGELTVNPAKDAAFLAGWIALRFLKDAKAAEQHFRRMLQTVDGPLSRGKANYWLARAYEAQGNREKRTEHLKAATRSMDTFHGLLARQLLEPRNSTIRLALPKAPTPAETKRFNDRDSVKAAVLAYKAGLEGRVTRAFLSDLRGVMETEAEMAMLAHLAEAFGDTQMAVRIGKTAVARDFNLYVYAYPIHALPSYAPLRKPSEKAMIFGIGRQESEFNTSIVSGAGARGVLQVMPITARHVCRDYKINCNIGRLLVDKAYNASIGSAYIADRMDEFGGSYILTLTGYNAGPGRTRQWLRELGDPREASVDELDWIERIPFEETRNYVMKVLSNVQIYRARLGEGANALRIVQDLQRGRRGGDNDIPVTR